MKFVLALVCLFAVSAFADDRTDSVLETFKSKGLSDLSDTDLGGVNMHLHLTDGAKAIITDKKFDIADDKFDQKAFEDFIATRFKESVAYFRKIVTESPVNDIHVIVVDLGEGRKGTISQATPGTRVLELDIRRWHKLYKGERAFLADLTSIHEFTHTNNYFLDEKEVKKQRELIAVVFESLNLLRLHGFDAYKKSYLKKTSAPVAKPDDVLGEDYKGMPALRALTHSFVTKVTDGVYVVATETNGDKTAALERFAMLALSDKEVGSKGFDNALAAVGYKDKTGATLTINRMQLDLFEELSQSSSHDEHLDNGNVAGNRPGNDTPTSVQGADGVRPGPASGQVQGAPTPAP